MHAQWWVLWGSGKEAIEISAVCLMGTQARCVMLKAIFIPAKVFRQYTLKIELPHILSELTQVLEN